jgi:protein CpxP
MKTDSFYKIVIVALLLLNLWTLVYLLKTEKAPPPHPDGPRKTDQMIIERMSLDEKQQELFDELKHEHHSQMLEIQKESGRLHRSLFKLLQNEVIDTAAKDSLLLLIQQTNMDKELVTFDHFQKLRGILRPEQYKGFDDFVEELSRRIMGPHRKPH